MSIANRHPEKVADAGRDVRPRWPPPDVLTDVLTDFLAWMRAEKGIRVCTKTGERPSGESVYEYVYRQAQADAAREFVQRMGIAPYRPPEPLVEPDATLTGLMASSEEAVVDEVAEDKFFDLF